MLDHSDFQDTDIPFEIPLPEKAHLSVSQYKETCVSRLVISHCDRIMVKYSFHYEAKIFKSVPAIALYLHLPSIFPVKWLPSLRHYVPRGVKVDTRMNIPSPGCPVELNILSWCLFQSY